MQGDPRSQRVFQLSAVSYQYQPPATPSRLVRSPSRENLKKEPATSHGIREANILSATPSRLADSPVLPHGRT